MRNAPGAVFTPLQKPHLTSSLLHKLKRHHQQGWQSTSGLGFFPFLNIKAQIQMASPSNLPITVSLKVNWDFDFFIFSINL